MLKETRVAVHKAKNSKVQTKPANLGGLIACTKYDVDMKVENLMTKKTFTYSNNVFTKFDGKVGKIELKVDKTESDSARLSWNILQSDTACILKYEVVVTDRNNQQVFEALNIKSTSAVVPSLSSCDVYSAQVTAISARDERIVSSSKTFQIKSQTEEVVSRLNLSVDDVKDDSVSLSWTSESTKCLQEYQLKVRYSDDKIVYDNNFYNNSVVISDLTSCNNYSVELVALKDDKSALQAVIKSFYIHALPVRNVTISVKKSSAQVKWIPPPNLDCVANFTLTYDIVDCQYDIGENVSCSVTQTLDKTKTTAKLTSLPLSKRFLLAINANEVTSTSVASHAKTWPFNTIDFEKFLVKSINVVRLKRTKLQLSWGFDSYLKQHLKYFEIFIDGEVLTSMKQYTTVDVAACLKNYNITIRCVSIDGFEGANVTYQTDLNDDIIPLSAVKNNFTFVQENELLTISWTPLKAEESCIAHYEVDFFEEHAEVKEPRFVTKDFDSCVDYAVRITPVSLNGKPGNEIEFEFVTRASGKFIHFKLINILFHF